MSKVFLGGTCNESNWRAFMESNLTVDYFNPVVDDWTPDCIEKENDEKNNHCDTHLYVINSMMTGVYSIAEAVQSSLTKDKMTIFHVMPVGFDDGQLRSFEAVCKLIEGNGGIAYIDVDLTRTMNLINEALG